MYVSTETLIILINIIRNLFIYGLALLHSIKTINKTSKFIREQKQDSNDSTEPLETTTYSKSKEILKVVIAHTLVLIPSILISTMFTIALDALLTLWQWKKLNMTGYLKNYITDTILVTVVMVLLSEFVPAFMYMVFVWKQGATIKESVLLLLAVIWGIGALLTIMGISLLYNLVRHVVLDDNNSLKICVIKSIPCWISAFTAAMAYIIGFSTYLDVRWIF